MSNPRNDQELLDKQFPSEEERLRRDLETAAYADSSIRREKARGYPVVNPLNPTDGDWLYSGRSGRGGSR